MRGDHIIRFGGDAAPTRPVAVLLVTVIDRKLINLPAGFSYARDLTLVGQVTEADTADAIVSQVSMRTAADLAAVVLTGGELGGLLLLQDHRFFSHYRSSCA